MVYQGPLDGLEDFARRVTGARREEGQALGEWMLELVSIDGEDREGGEERIRRMVEANRKADLGGGGGRTGGGRERWGGTSSRQSLR